MHRMEGLASLFDIKTYCIDNAQRAGKCGADRGIVVCVRTYKLQTQCLIAENRLATLRVPRDHSYGHIAGRKMPNDAPAQESRAAEDRESSKLAYRRSLSVGSEMPLSASCAACSSERPRSARVMNPTSCFSRLITGRRRT